MDPHRRRITESIIDNGKETEKKKKETIERAGFSVARIVYACNRNVR